MDEAQSQSVLTSTLKLFGVDKYNRLISSVDETATRGSFRYWQSDLFAKLKDQVGLAIDTVDEYVAIFRNASTATKDITFDEFLTNPVRYYYMEPVVIPNEWIVQAWEDSGPFRENVTYEFSREASKNGDIECLEGSLRHLVSILPIRRVIELYCEVRKKSPNRESEFRPTFERILGERVSELPAAFTDAQLADILAADAAQGIDILQPKE